VPHVVLLGDSIFDNAAYVADRPAVIDHLRRALPADWRATLLAVDGDTTNMVAVRLPGLPADATHLIVSVGGNDALMHIDLLGADHNILPQLADGWCATRRPTTRRCRRSSRRPGAGERSRPWWRGC
jgi:hypothetical protein